jgi:hypothetical protein
VTVNKKLTSREWLSTWTDYKIYSTQTTTPFMKPNRNTKFLNNWIEIEKTQRISCVSKIFQQAFLVFLDMLQDVNFLFYFPLFSWIFAFIMWVYWSKSSRNYPGWCKPSKCKPTRYLIPLPPPYYVANYCNMLNILIKKTSLSFNWSLHFVCF